LGEHAEAAERPENYEIFVAELSSGQRMSSGCTKIILKKRQNELTQKTLKVEINMFRH